MSAKPAFTVKNTSNGLFFGGFNADHSVKWVPEQDAQHMDEDGARMQAMLFARFHDELNTTTKEKQA